MGAMLQWEYAKTDHCKSNPMRLTSLLQRLIGVTGVVVQGFSFAPDGLTLDVRPRQRRPRCGDCGRRGPCYDRARTRRWRHLGLADLKIWLRYAPRRVHCRRCGIRTEEVPWARASSRFTKDFEELVAYMAVLTDKTAVTRLLGISWRSVGAIVARLVEQRLDGGRLANLRRIGVDEFSYRKRHRYLTVIVDHDSGKAVWASKGKGAEALASFFQALGKDGCATLETVTMDMSGGYKKAVAEHAPQAQVVFDRFHVQRLASDAVDAVRREQLQDLRGSEQGKNLFRIRFSLWKNSADLTADELEKLSTIERSNKPLYRAYLLKESLVKALGYKQPWRVRKALKAFLRWAARSKLAPFVKLGRTIRKHLEGILAYTQERMTNGIVEGINNRLRMIARRAYGFHSPEALIAMLFLCCGGIELNPRLP